jgi:SOS-response transcriptional repressor LexA
MPPDAVALTVMDASMSPEFSAGDLVIVSRSRKPLANDVVIAVVDGGALMRTFVPRGNDSAGNPVFDLLSTSADYPTVTCNSANGGKVLAVVVSHWRTRIR